MAPIGGWLNLKLRAGRIVRILFLLFLFGVAAMSITTFAAVEYTAQPEFCRTCHIMEPYYQSWVNSGHKDVGCIECHYEPGSLETLEGKFKALSQLSKYITRTQGTKPWAEVSDQSCMRSGCHSVRMLEGPIQFGRVAFDHRHHLLESRRGRRLRCVSCHSQIVQGEHVTVTESVCFMCHFMPDEHGEISKKTGDCLMCHGPPKEPVMVAGREFVHDEYVARGVSCVECHAPVIQGDGVVRKERCHSCHGEVGHIERIGETAFLHEMHVTDHKVECFECHDEIHHGLLEHQPLGPAQSEGCGACHAGSHDASSQLYAGQGAIGVPDSPSRMYATRVVCEACHTGRSSGAGLVHALGDAARRGSGQGSDRGTGVTGSALANGLGSSLAQASASDAGEHVRSAGNVDCIHCHGTDFDGMLDRWQGAVGSTLERLEGALGELEAELPREDDDPLRVAWREARHNVDLVRSDGSRGAHNVDYALDALFVSAERIDSIRETLVPGTAASATRGFPARSENGCTACHLGIEAETGIEVAGVPFSHARHLAEADLDCSACHSVEHHGQPTFPRADCASCHHTERSGFDPSDCAACHDAQSQVLAGTFADFEELPGAKADFECSQCHGEPPDVGPPDNAMCALCHEEDHAETARAWIEETDELVERLRAAVDASPVDADPQALQTARGVLELLSRDGSHGAHNSEFARALLEGALERLGD